MNSDALRHLVTGVAHRVARQTGCLHILDELEAAGYEGAAHALLTFDEERGEWDTHLRHHVWAMAFDAARTWSGRGIYPKFQAAEREPDTFTMPTTRSAEDIYMDGEDVREWAARIAELPWKWRESLMAWGRGETQEETAARLGITASRVSQLRGRACRQLGIEHVTHLQHVKTA